MRESVRRMVEELGAQVEAALEEASRADGPYRRTFAVIAGELGLEPDRAPVEEILLRVRELRELARVAAAVRMEFGFRVDTPPEELVRGVVAFAVANERLRAKLDAVRGAVG